jgi:hypothetical protein
MRLFSKNVFLHNKEAGGPASLLLLKGGLIWIYIVFTITCSAQSSIGIAQGLTFNTVRLDPAPAGMPGDIQIVPQTGFSSSVYFQQQFGAKFSARMDLQFVKKNYLLERTGIYKGVYQSIHNDYLQVPLTGFVSLQRKKIRASLGLGMYAGYWLQSNRESRIPDIFSVRDIYTSSGETTTVFDLAYTKEKYVFKETDNRFELGLTCMANIGYMFTSGNCISAAISLLTSLSPQEKEYTLHQMKTKNRTAVFSIDYLIRLRK